MKRKILATILTMAVAASSFNVCSEVQASSGKLTAREQTEIAQGTLMFQKAGDSFKVSQNANEEKTFEIRCNKSGKYVLRYESHISKPAIIVVGVRETTKNGNFLKYQTTNIRPFTGFTGSMNTYHEANVPIELKAQNIYRVTIKTAAWAEENREVKNLNYTLSFEKQPTIKNIYVDNNACVIEAGGFNWWGLSGWAFKVTYSDGSVQHLHGPRGYHPNEPNPYLPYDDYGNYFVFELKDSNQEADFYNMVEGSYPVNVKISTGQVFQDVLKIQTPHQVTYSVGDTFWEGVYKYKVTGASEVAFAGIRKNSIENIVIPNNIKIGQKTYKVTSIAKKALKKSNIKKVVIGSNVQVIGASAFEGAAKLSAVSIGSGVTKINSYSFKNCKKLKQITIKSSKLKYVGKGALKGIYAKAKIKVPSKKLTYYKKLFKNKGQKSTVEIGK